MRMERFRCPRVRDWESISIAKSSQNIVKCIVAWVRIRMIVTRYDPVGRLLFQTNAGPIQRMTADPKFLVRASRSGKSFREPSEGMGYQILQNVISPFALEHASEYRD